jgi:hypothetical protein
MGVLLVTQCELGTVKLHLLLIGLHGLLLLTVLWTGLAKWSQFCWMLIDASVFAAHDSSDLDLHVVMCPLISCVVCFGFAVRGHVFPTMDRAFPDL